VNEDALAHWEAVMPKEKKNLSFEKERKLKASRKISLLKARSCCMQGPLRGPVKWGSIFNRKFMIKDI